MSTLRHNYLINLKGNVSAKSREFTNSVKQMSQRHDRSMRNMTASSRRMTRNVDSAFRRSSRAIGTSIRANRGEIERFGKYAAGIAVVAGGMAIRKVANLEERIAQLGVNAGESGEGMKVFAAKVKGGIGEAAREWSVGTDQILDGVDALVEKTGDLEFAQANIDNLAMVIRATGGTGADVGALMSEIQKMNIKDPAKVLELMNIMTAQGKFAAFTIADQAGLGERTFSAYGPRNVKQVREMGAALQLIRQGTGSSEQAATAFEALLRSFQDEKKIKQMEDMGVQVLNPEKLKEGKEELNSVLQTMVDLVIAAKGSRLELGKILDSEAMRSINSLINQFNDGVDIQAEANKILKVESSGMLAIDASEMKKPLNASITKASETVFHALEKDLSGVVRGLADFINSLDKEEMNLFIAAIETATVALLTMAGIAVVGKLGAGVARTSRGVKKVAKFFKKKPKITPKVPTPTPSRAGTLGGYTSPVPKAVPAPVIPQSAGTMSKLVGVTGSVVSRAALPVTIGVATFEAANIVMDDSKTTRQKLDAGTEVVGGLAGAGAGAAYGGMVGATAGTFIFPGLATAVLAAAGSVIGGAVGYFGGSFAGDKAGDVIFSPEKEVATIKQTVDATTASIAESQHKMLQAMPLPTAGELTTMMDANASKTANETAAVLATALANNPGSLTIHVQASGGASAKVVDIKQPSRLKINAGSTISRLTE